MARKKPAKVKLSIYLPPELVDFIQEEKERELTSESHVIRRILAIHYGFNGAGRRDEEEERQPVRQNKPHRTSRPQSPVPPRRVVEEEYDDEDELEGKEEETEEDDILPPFPYRNRN